MDQFVVHQRVHALAGREGLEGVGQRRNVELEPVVWLNVSMSITVIHKILQQDRCGLGRPPPEYAALPSQRIGERAYGMRLEEAQVVVVEKIEIPGFHAIDIDGALI